MDKGEKWEERDETKWTGVNEKRKWIQQSNETNFLYSDEYGSPLTNGIK